MMTKAVGLKIGGAVLFAVCAGFLPLILPGPFHLHVAILTMMYIILSSSLRLVSLSGQMSLAHGGMVTMGAYTSALLAMKLGLSFWLTMPIAGLGTALVATLVGYPFVRLKGIYFSIVTVFFSEMVVLIAQQWEGLTGGSGGIFGIPRPGKVAILSFLSIDFSSKAHFYYLALVMMVVSLAVIYLIEKSRIGLTLRGVKQADSLAESVGIDTRGYKVLAFAMGCFFAGLVGAFFSHYISAVAPDTFGFLFTIYILVYMVVGGAESFAGPILGAFVLTIFPEATRAFKEFVPFFFAAVLIAVIFFVPDGMAGLVGRWIKRIGWAKDA
jgi:branched-chain amino acid transport system permease protein